MPHEDAKAYISRRLLKKTELDRLEIKAILPDLGTTTDVVVYRTVIGGMGQNDIPRLRVN
jgi:hypothetical protein